MRCWCLLLSALLLGACGDAREQKMRDSVDYAQAELHRAQIEPLAGARLRNALETTESPVDYLVSGRSDAGNYGPYRWRAPQQPFDVVINGAVDLWKIDGYGASLDKPLVSIEVKREP